jgi:DNA polymerase
MIVGEAFGETEERTGEPFAGSSGMELNRMLHDAGMMRSECYVTNVVNARPPANNLDLWMPATKSRVTHDMVQLRGRFVKPIFKEGYESLRREIDLVKPRLIIALGNAALWALADRRGILKWRGSLLRLDGDEAKQRVIPTIHPAAVLRQWEWRVIAVMDLRRARRELVDPVDKPRFAFTIKPNLETVLGHLRDLQAAVEVEPRWIDLDLETRAGHISCCGLAWSATEALCIPLMLRGSPDGYWLAEEEAKIVHALYRLLTHPNCWVRGQNLLYDCQYTYKHWHFIPNVKQDTMISHHTLWPGLKKSLDFQASMYCDYYVQWKPEKEVWKEGG